MEQRHSAFPVPKGAVVREDTVDVPNEDSFGAATLHFRHFSDSSNESLPKRIRLLMICGFGATQYGYAAMVAQLLTRNFFYEIVTYDHRSTVFITKLIHRFASYKLCDSGGSQ
jgi:hypothetical protein